MSGLVSGYGSSDDEDTSVQVQAVTYDASAAIRPAPEDEDDDEDDETAIEQAKKDLYGLEGATATSGKMSRVDRSVKVAAAPDVLAEVSIGFYRRPLVPLSNNALHLFRIPMLRQR